VNSPSQLSSEYNHLLNLYEYEPKAVDIRVTAAQPDIQWIDKVERYYPFIDGIPVRITNPGPDDVTVHCDTQMGKESLLVPAWNCKTWLVPVQLVLSDELEFHVQSDSWSMELPLPVPACLQNLIVPTKSRTLAFIDGGHLSMCIPYASTCTEVVEADIRLSIFVPEGEAVHYVFGSAFQSGVHELEINREGLEHDLDPGYYRACLEWKHSESVTHLDAVVSVQESAGCLEVVDRSLPLMLTFDPEIHALSEIQWRRIGGRKNRLELVHRPFPSLRYDSNELVLAELDGIEVEKKGVQLAFAINDLAHIALSSHWKNSVVLRHIDDLERATETGLHIASDEFRTHRCRLDSLPILGNGELQIELDNLRRIDSGKYHNSHCRLQVGSRNTLRVPCSVLREPRNGVFWLPDLEKRLIHVFKLRMPHWTKPVPIIPYIGAGDILRIRLDIEKPARLRPAWELHWVDQEGQESTAREFHLQRGLREVERRVSCLVSWGELRWKLCCDLHVPGRFSKKSIGIISHSLSDVKVEK